MTIAHTYDAAGKAGCVSLTSRKADGVYVEKFKRARGERMRGGLPAGPLFTEYPGCHGRMPCGVLARALITLRQ